MWARLKKMLQHHSTRNTRTFTSHSLQSEHDSEEEDIASPEEEYICNPLRKCLVTQSHIHNIIPDFSGNLINRRKKHSCLFCCKMYSKFACHLEQVRYSEVEVAKLLDGNYYLWHIYYKCPVNVYMYHSFKHPSKNVFQVLIQIAF